RLRGVPVGRPDRAECRQVLHGVLHLPLADRGRAVRQPHSSVVAGGCHSRETGSERRPVKFDLRNAVEVLERTPAVIASLLAGLPPDRTTPNEGPETWSPHDVVGHLIHAEETDWMTRTRIILSGEAERRFEPFVRDRHLDANRGRPLSELLDRFADLRRKN